MAARWGPLGRGTGTGKEKGKGKGKVAAAAALRLLPSGVPAKAADWKRRHLWFCLLALGFDPQAAEKFLDRELHLGVSMFDAPNAAAFHVVAQFLFSKLDPVRAAKVFRDCLLPEQITRDTEFRKQCCSWLKDIANESKNYLPPIVTSSFLSPAGSKFIHLMYRFARYVMIKNLKKNSVGSDTSSTEAVNLIPEDMRKAKARCNVARNKLLRILQKKDVIIREYNKKSQLLIKEIKQTKSEYAYHQQQLLKMRLNGKNKNDKTERIQKVRSMWTFVMDTLTSLKKEIEIVDSVIEGRVDLYTLTGTNVNVPQLLADRVESEIHEVCTGNLYEGENLNFLTVIQLLNGALRILRDECCQFESKHFTDIKNTSEFQNKILLNLKAVRQKIEEQHCKSLRELISGKQKELEMKWKSHLDQCPYSLKRGQDPDLDLLEAVSCFFHPAEEAYKDTVSFQLEIPLLDIYDSICEKNYQKDEETSGSMMDNSTLQPTRWISSVSLDLSGASESKDMLIEKDFRTETYNGKEKPVTPKISEEMEDLIISVEENTVTCTRSAVQKEDLLKKATEELAEEVAKTVTSESPQSGGGKGITLEDLISSQAFNPFLTRQQIPRTPENLLTEIRSSWRKAIQTDESPDVELAPAEVMTEESPMDASTTVQNETDTTLVRSTSASPVFDFDSTSTEFKAQNQMRKSNISGCPVWETSGVQENEGDKEQELERTVLSRISVDKTEEPASLDVENSINTPDKFSERNSRINTVPSNQLWDSLVDRILQWDAPSVLMSDSCEVTEAGILHETLPKEFDSIDPNKSTSSESDCDVLNSKDIPGSTKIKGCVEELNIDRLSLVSRYEMLKENASGNREKLHHTHAGDESVSYISDLNLRPEKERDDLCSTRDLFSLDEEFTKAPSPLSFPKGNNSLSPLLMFTQDLEEMASKIHKISSNLVRKLKGEEQLNEKLHTQESSSGQNL
ncbi:HAUS augmin-like complex subunit 6 isoform X1 [Anas platyrhynchos]|uniref:HAUS augmin like complex subunit 6 n=1 Tax=Anas platyrhynchos platyrhynchos TaxID=8840 RepID=U3IEJ0_ANAPP|nr:HAUS augmin-like complex subunit 6 isoform X2 [Anas platyrhynchos]